MTLGRWMLVLMFVCAGASADILIFKHQGNGSGSLDGKGFEKANFTITAIGDTADRQRLSAGWFINHQSASIRIEGVGEFDILTWTRHFVNNGRSLVGFSRADDGLDLFNGPSDGRFGKWDMLNPIGPISGTGYLLQWGRDPKIRTSGGILMFEDEWSDAIFTASVQPACNPCDTNCDGSVDLIDVGQFIELILGKAKPCDWCSGDTNDDGSIDLTDMEQFIECLLG